MDSLEIDGEQAYRTLSELIDAGLIRRAGESGAAQLAFLLTTEGKAVLPALADGEAAMLVQGITLADYRVLEAIGKSAALGPEKLLPAPGWTGRSSAGTSAT